MCGSKALFGGVGKEFGDFPANIREMWFPAHMAREL